MVGGKSWIWLGWRKSSADNTDATTFRPWEKRHRRLQLRYKEPPSLKIEQQPDIAKKQDNESPLHEQLTDSNHGVYQIEPVGVPAAAF